MNATNAGAHLAASAVQEQRRIGRLLQGWRKEMGLGEEEVARPVGVDTEVIASVERGDAEVRLSRLERILASLGHSVDALIVPTDAAAG